MQDAALLLPEESEGDCLYDVACELARYLRDPESGDSSLAPLFYELLALSTRDLRRRGHPVDVHMPRAPEPFSPPTLKAVEDPVSVGKAGAGADLTRAPSPLFEDDDWLCAKCQYGNDDVRCTSSLRCTHGCAGWLMSVDCGAFSYFCPP